MSWRGSGDFRSSGNWKGTGGSSPDGGGAGGPPVIYLIAAAICVGVIALIVVAALGAMSGGPPATAVAPAAPTEAAAAAPTEAAAAAPTEAAAAAPTEAAAAPTAVAPTAAAPTVAPTAAATTAPTATTAAGAAKYPTEPLGPSVTSGSGDPLAIGSDGEMLLFDKTKLEATAGKTYTLTFTNNSTAVQHNWVLVDGDVAVANTVANAATAAQLKARNVLASVPPADTPGLLAAMPIINPGQKGTITFTAPTKPGTYTFICTFPAHYIPATGTGMMGELVVK